MTLAAPDVTFATVISDEGGATPPANFERHVPLEAPFMNRANSPRSQKYAKVVRALRQMSMLPEHHDFHIDQEIALRAERVLGLLWNNFEREAPTVFPHEGDTVVFSWDDPVVRQLLSIDTEGLDLLGINKRTKMACSHLVDLSEPIGFEDWLTALGGRPSNETNEQINFAINAVSKHL